VRHQRHRDLLLEFGYPIEGVAQWPSRHLGLGLVRNGSISWNWCGTGRRQPETDLILRKLRQVQEICSDKLLVWDDDGTCHWSWGTCSLEEAGFEPLQEIDRGLASLQPSFSRQGDPLCAAGASQTGR
jgi:hypothetical protein